MKTARSKRAFFLLHFVVFHAEWHDFAELSREIEKKVWRVSVVPIPSTVYLIPRTIIC